MIRRGMDAGVSAIPKDVMTYFQMAYQMTQTQFIPHGDWGGNHSLLSNRQSRPAFPTLEQLIHLSDEEVQMPVGHYLICLMAVIVAIIICPLVHLLQTAEFDIKKEAAWELSNATYGGDPNQIKRKHCRRNYFRRGGGGHIIVVMGTTIMGMEIIGTVPQRNFVRPMPPSTAPFVSSQPVRPFVNPLGFPQVVFPSGFIKSKEIPMILDVTRMRNGGDFSKITV
ncbi:hypothetical protein IFM89_017059 [Coptis chinensis]|uniref:Uncharacterized protein n=1 Tax=Coptis chinensis TaxID=261450 RepID=A0A835HKH3_9MAGN|nr:hypothetical protein IFM89_017059 [Coptis chinensis]